MARRLAIPLTVLGGVIFVVAAIASSNPVYGVALLTFAAGLACFFTFPLNPRARSPFLAHAGLALAIAAAVVDAGIDFADAVGFGSTVTTVLIVVGGAAAFAGRTTGPAGRARRGAFASGSLTRPVGGRSVRRGRSEGPQCAGSLASSRGWRLLPWRYRPPRRRHLRTTASPALHGRCSSTMRGTRARVRTPGRRDG